MTRKRPSDSRRINAQAPLICVSCGVVTLSVESGLCLPSVTFAAVSEAMRVI